MDLAIAPPDNLSLDPSVRASLVESDMYDICERIKEIDPNLKIVHLIDGETQSFVIMETGKDGKEYYVMKAKELDARILEKLRYLLHVPFEERIRILEKGNKEFEAAEHERELDELYERVGRPMWTELERTGFIDRPVSYPKKPKRKDAIHTKPTPS